MKNGQPVKTKPLFRQVLSNKIDASNYLYHFPELFFQGFVFFGSKREKLTIHRRYHDGVGVDVNGWPENHLCNKNCYDKNCYC